MKTHQEVQALKDNWLGDPSWDIEDTEGFQEHRKELLNFRLFNESIWKQDWTNKLQEKSEDLGCPGNYKLANHVMILEREVQELQRGINKMEDSIHKRIDRINDQVIALNWKV